MRFFITTTALAVGAAMIGAACDSHAANGEHLLNCTARVLYSEAVPFAPEGSWLVNVTLEITPSGGNPYATTLHARMPWQGPPPRRGQAFRLLCDPANPDRLRLA